MNKAIDKLIYLSADQNKVEAYVSDLALQIEKHDSEMKKIKLDASINIAQGNSTGYSDANQAIFANTYANEKLRFVDRENFRKRTQLLEEFKKTFYLSEDSSHIDEYLEVFNQLISKIF